MSANYPWSRTKKFIKQHVPGLAGGIVLLLIIVAALSADAVSPFDPLKQNPALQLMPPSREHPFGTDYLGRDMLSRVIWGARASLGISFSAVALGTALGAGIGLWSGYWGGWVDLLIQRTIDIMMTLPGVITAMALVAVLGPGAHNVVAAIAFVIIPGISRVVRGSVIQLRSAQFVEAAVALGASRRDVLLRHILPNCLAPVLVMATAALGNSILIESSLSFLGVGVPPNIPTWGGMMSGQARTWLQIAHWMALFPGLALTTTVIAFNLFGDFVRDVLDPKSKNEG